MNQLSTDKLLELSRGYEDGTIHIAPRPDGTLIYVPDGVHGMSRWTDDPSQPWERRSNGSSFKPMMKLPDQLTVHKYQYRLTENIWGKKVRDGSSIRKKQRRSYIRTSIKVSRKYLWHN